MSITKEALIRYRAINKALVQNRIVSKEKLIRVCTEAIGNHVAWRTIAGDINAMRSNEQLGYFAPIKNERGVGYSYTDKNYSIDQIPLQEDEITALSFASKLLMQFSHVKIFSTFSGAVEKLSQHLDVQLQNKDVADMASYIAFEDHTSDGGSLFLNEMLQHIRQKTVVTILYNSFSSGKQKKHILHPYYIKEFRNRWYVLGYHQEYRELRTLALERIVEMEPNYAETYRLNDYDLESYYKDAVGVSINATAPEHVELEVTKSQWQYLASQPLHPSQKLIKTEKEVVTIALYVICNYELKSALLSMGRSVKVLKPLSLKKDIEEEVKLILENYSM